MPFAPAPPGTTYHGLIDIGELKKGEILLVLGASGGVGMAAIDIGKAVGAIVIACASSEKKLQACKEAGADHLIDYTKDGFRDALKKIAPKGVDVTYDPVGGKWSELALRSTGWAGRFLVVGFAAGGEVPKDAIPAVPLNLALLNERKILGVFWGMWKALDQNVGNRKNIGVMMEWIKEGKLTPYVSKIYPIAEYLKACDDLMNRRAIGKIVLDPNASPAAKI